MIADDVIPDDVRVWMINNAMDVATLLVWLHSHPKWYGQLVTLATLEGARDEMEQRLAWDEDSANADTEDT